MNNSTIPTKTVRENLLKLIEEGKGLVIDKNYGENLVELCFNREAFITEIDEENNDLLIDFEQKWYENNEDYDTEIQEFQVLIEKQYFINL